MRLLFAVVLAFVASAAHADWQVTTVDAPARVIAVDSIDDIVRVNAGGLWYRLSLDRGRATFTFIDKADAGPVAHSTPTLADFDGDGVDDIAVAADDGTGLRLLSFVPKPHEIAIIALPRKTATNVAAVGQKPPVLIVGLEDGTLAIARTAP